MEKRKNGQKFVAGEIDKFIGNQLMAKRKLLKLHQEHIAKKIGVCIAQYQQYETGKIKIFIGIIFKIFTALEMTQNEKADFWKLVGNQAQEIDNKNNANKIAGK
jgi:transcriptional regulator with XRE-family HTH domain